MKVKFSVIPFALAAIAMVFFKVMSVFGVDESGNFLGMDRMVLSYTVIGIALALFVVCIVINIFDRKTAPVYPVKKNYAAGALSILSGISVLAASISAFLASSVDSEYYLMTIISAIFSIPAGIALAVMAKVHFTGKSNVSGSSVIYIFPALWGCTELVLEFLNATKVSISATDLSGLFCYIFLTLYYFSHAMILSRIKGRNPVKACFIYGLPAVALSIAHGISILLTASQEGMTLDIALSAVQFIVLALYALSFIVEMTINSYTKDELEVVYSLPKEDSSEEEEKYINTRDYDDLVFSTSSSSTDHHVNPSDDYYSSAKGLDDFIIGFNTPDDNEKSEDGKKQERAERKAEKKAEKAEKKAAKMAAKAEKEQAKQSEPAAEVIPEPVVKVEEEPVAPAQPEAVEEPVPAKPEPKFVKLTEEPVEETAQAEPAPAVEEVTLSDVAADSAQDSDDKVAARLSEIDKLLQELDSKAD